MKKLFFQLTFILVTIINGNAQTFPDGTILQSATDGQKYIIAGNALFRLNDNSGISINPRDIVNVNASVLSDLNKIPKDTTLLREINADETYIMNKGRRCKVPPKLLLLTYAEPYVNIVPKGSLNIIPLGDKLPDVDILTPNHFDTLQKVIAYRLKMNYNTISANNFQIGDGVTVKKLDNVQISRLKNVNKLITAKFGRDATFGRVLFLPKADREVSEPIIPPGPIVPPDDGWIIPSLSSSLRGFADLHCHMFADLAFGGKFYVGSSYGSYNTALAPCSYSSAAFFLARSATYLAALAPCITTCSILVIFPPALMLCYGTCHIGAVTTTTLAINIFAKGKPHGVEGSGDAIGQMMKLSYKYTSKNTDYIPWAIPEMVAGGVTYHNATGNPDFEGWPRWDDFNHQRTHLDFLRRAYEGGLRLMVMFAVESKRLHDILQIVGEVSDDSYDEMNGIYKQIAEAKKMEQYVADNQGGWLQIVYSPGEAETAIKAGKLAIVLGTENGLFIDNPYKYPIIAKNLQELFDAGVRHVFTVHQNDNNFGGAAYFATRIQDDSFLGVSDIDSVEIDPMYKAQTKGRKNAKGLTPQGVFLQQSLMSLGMIYDIDHMSEKTKESTLYLAVNAKYPGLVASHCGFTDINDLHQLHEGQLQLRQLIKLNNLGGVIGLIVNQGVFIDDVKQYGIRVPYSCGGTTETFAQAYSYALDNFSIPRNNRGIAFGGDNTPIPFVGPRFGGEGCPGTGSSSKSSLVYPFTSQFDGKKMPKSTVGNKVYDFNYDGMAHIGMYPDMIADLHAIGLSAADLEPIYKSAEEYIKMWKKADSIKATGYIKFLTDPSQPDLFFYDVADANPIIYVLSKGFKSIVQNAGGNEIVTLPHEIVKGLPNAKIAYASFILVERISKNQSKILISAKDASGNPLSGTVDDENGNFIGNTNTEIIITTNCSVTTTQTNINPHRGVNNRIVYDKLICKNYTCRAKDVTVILSGFSNNKLTINLTGKECVTQETQ